MSLSNDELVNEFATGARRGKASRMQIKQVKDLTQTPDALADADPESTVVVGFGWAIYAHQTLSGSTTVFEGWADWAKEVGKAAHATPSHISSLENVADDLSGETPQSDDKPQALVRQLEGNAPNTRR